MQKAYGKIKFPQAKDLQAKIIFSKQFFKAFKNGL